MHLFLQEDEPPLARTAVLELSCSVKFIRFDLPSQFAGKLNNRASADEIKAFKKSPTHPAG